MNMIKTLLLSLLIIGLITGTGYMLADILGFIIAFCLAAAGCIYVHMNADRFILYTHKARLASEYDNLIHIRTYIDDTLKLAEQAGLPAPQVYVIDTLQPNAFATGRNPSHASVVATMGLLQMLNRKEVASVMAHELAHIKNRDTLSMTITAAIAGVLSGFTNSLSQDQDIHPKSRFSIIPNLIFSPFAAALVHLSIRREREYAADRVGAQILGDSSALASALEKIDRGARTMLNVAVERNPALAHMFIINPLHEGRRANLFATHPDTASRITRLRRMGGGNMNRASNLSGADM